MTSIVCILLMIFTFIATNTLQPTGFIYFASLACLVLPLVHHVMDTTQHERTRNYQRARVETHTQLSTVLYLGTDTDRKTVIEKD